jgi:hypothetical protein
MLVQTAEGPQSLTTPLHGLGHHMVLGEPEPREGLARLLFGFGVAPDSS